MMSTRLILLLFVLLTSLQLYVVQSEELNLNPVTTDNAKLDIDVNINTNNNINSNSNGNGNNNGDKSLRTATGGFINTLLVTLTILSFAGNLSFIIYATFPGFRLIKDKH